VGGWNPSGIDVLGGISHKRSITCLSVSVTVSEFIDEIKTSEIMSSQCRNFGSFGENEPVRKLLKF
jgi:hypothetical protein